MMMVMVVVVVGMAVMIVVMIEVVVVYLTCSIRRATMSQTETGASKGVMAASAATPAGQIIRLVRHKLLFISNYPGSPGAVCQCPELSFCSVTKLSLKDGRKLYN